MLKLTKKYNGEKMQKKFLTIIMGMLLLATPFFHAEEDSIQTTIPGPEHFETVEELINYIKTITFDGKDGESYTIKSFDNESRLQKQLEKIFKRDERRLIVKKQLGEVSDKRAKNFIKFVVGAFRENVVFSNGINNVKGIIRFDAHRGSRFAEPNISVECFADMSSLTVARSALQTGKKDNYNVDNNYTFERSTEVRSNSTFERSKSTLKKGNSESVDEADEEVAMKVDDDEKIDEEEVSSDAELKGDTNSIIDYIFERITDTKFDDGIELNGDDETFKTDLRNKIETLCKRKNRKTLMQLDTVDISDQDVPNVKRLARGVYKLAVPFTQNGKNLEGFLILKGISNNIFKKQKAGISYQFFINSGVYEFEGKDNVATKSVKIMNYNPNSTVSVIAKVNMIYTKLLESNPILKEICSKNSGHEKIIKDKLKELLKKKTYKNVKFPTLSRKSKLNSDKKGALVLTDDRIYVTKFKSKKGKSTIELSFKDLADGDKIKYVYLSFSNGLNKTLKIRIHKNKGFVSGDKSVNNDENDDQDTGGNDFVVDKDARL